MMAAIETKPAQAQSACCIRVRGVVQGVGFRPFVYRLARVYALNGWVLNGEQGVEIFVEGADEKLRDFVQDIRAQAPPAASIVDVFVNRAEPLGFHEFSIRESTHRDRPTVRISPDLPICEDCLAELFDPANPRFRYPYINCTNCGPRYSIIFALPYDRPNTTMNAWPLDACCSSEYHDPANRRFHAQPVACASCGPQYYLSQDGSIERKHPIETAAALLREGKIVAVKGLGGYHLACDARNPTAVAALRERKFRKERPFALMVRDLETARSIVHLDAAAEALLTSIGRPIVLTPATVTLEGVAPDNNDLGVMLPYTPLHHLLFAAGAPDILAMTSANRASEPIAYEDEGAFVSLDGIADAFLVGERPIARRVDDSVARAGAFGPVVLRRARGYAPSAVATFPTTAPILALGADLKNTITLAVNGQAFVSQHIGDLDHYEAFRAFEQTIRDLLAMYELSLEETFVVHDLHPQYRSTIHAHTMPSRRHFAVQHHRAHIASVLAERREWDTRVVAVSFDGTGYGDDGTIWGGEFFTGSIRHGFHRAAHLRPAILPGGDAAAQFPVQAAAGFLDDLSDLPDLCSAPFHFPSRYKSAQELVQKAVHSFTTTSAGRLFDTVAALLGFTRELTFEGQAAIWLEQLACRGTLRRVYPFPFVNDQLDYQPLLSAIIEDRLRGEDPRNIARSFQHAMATAIASAVRELCARERIETVVLSGGVFQNDLLLRDLNPLLEAQHLRILSNHAVPTNDGGISLGQAAIAAFTGE